ncbi:large ribosomal subunit protein eL21 isoform X2 [Salarias fasciatus]|uniref:large ribosomal subunit protein eL21 isoform X2 n=1 Tax=Salarias fasciatus TaxID=181472 RepID=UPI0011764F96|nr:60S ribosomal protein L21 isoform X2 [Salarias fasciatus]
MARSLCPPTCASTRKATSLTSRAQAPFRRVCLTSATMARRGVSTMLPSMLLASLSTSRSGKGRILAKRINVRIEHVKHSKSRDSFLQRVKENESRKLEAKQKGIWVELKRQPAPPREAHFVSTKKNEPQLLEPIPYEFMA